jgi:hypothetical protein
MSTATAVWLLYTEDRLDDFLAALGLDATTAQSKRDKADLLAAVPDLTPTGALTAHLAHQQASRVELQLAKQGATERPEAFIQRAKTHFQLVRATDNEAVTLLVNAAQPNIASFLTQNIQAGTTARDDLLQLVLDRFAPNRYQYHQLFRAYKMSQAQTAQEAGNELRRLYQGFLSLPQDQLHLHEPVIRPTVTAQLLDILPPTTAAAIRTELLKQPDMLWDDILKLADQILQVSPKHTQPRQTNQDAGTKAPRNQLHCSIHGYAGHSDATCKVQKYQREQGAKPNQQYMHAAQGKVPICFACGKEGHIAPNCPINPRPKENC